MGMSKREEYSFHPGSCRDSEKRGLFFIWVFWMKLSPARQGVGPSWRARSEGEILLSLKTKGLLCALITGWGGERGKGFREREWDSLGEIKKGKRDRESQRKEKKKSLKRQNSLRRALLLGCQFWAFREVSRTAWRSCQSLGFNLGALPDKPCSSQ